jgi:tRNA splicing endonuclease
MSVEELEQRVTALEREVRHLSGEVRVASMARNRSVLAAVERFKGDEGLLSIFKEAMKLREQDRRRARNRRHPRKSKQ